MNFGKKEPNFQELQKFILAKAAMVQKVAVYNAERSLRDGNTPKTATGSQSLAIGTSERLTLTPKVTAKPLTVLTLDPISELTKQLSGLGVEALANLRANKQAKRQYYSASY